jgi:hypothetical protein
VIPDDVQKNLMKHEYVQRNGRELTAVKTGLSSSPHSHGGNNAPGAGILSNTPNPIFESSRVHSISANDGVSTRRQNLGLLME